MPRPERPVDPEGGPVQRFAMDLRLLRAAADNPPYHLMAKVCHYSKASLSAAAGGNRLPTLDVTLAYVRACGGDIEEWRARWIAAQAEAGGRRGGLPSVEQAKEPSASSDRVLRWWAQQKLSAKLSGSALLVIAVAAFLFIALRPVGKPDNGAERSLQGQVVAPSSFAVPRYDGGRDPIADDSDPKRSRCAYDEDVMTLDSVEINTAANQFLGVAELRYSPACSAAWGRFTPSERLDYFKGARVTIAARRPVDGTNGRPYNVNFDGQAVFGNILLSRTGCVRISVVVEAAHGGGSATTACRTGF